MTTKKKLRGVDLLYNVVLAGNLFGHNIALCLSPNGFVVPFDDLHFSERSDLFIVCLLLLQENGENYKKIVGFDVLQYKLD